MRRAFVVAAVLWAAALPVASWAASHLPAPPAAYAFALLVYGAGSYVCHQAPQRSFQLWTVQMPVCARCTGLYLGAAAAALASMLGRSKTAAADARARLMLAGVPTLATLLFEWSTGSMPANWIRALCAAPLGGGVAWIFANAPPTAASSRLGPSRPEAMR